MGLFSLLKRSKVVFILLVFTFIVSGLIVNCLQLLTVPLYFANKRLFRIVNTKLVYLHWCSEWTRKKKSHFLRCYVLPVLLCPSPAPYSPSLEPPELG